MTHDRTEQLIRDAFADQADRATGARDVLAALRGRRRRPGLVLATAAVVVAVVAVAAFVVPEVFRRSSGAGPAGAGEGQARVTATSVLVVGVDAAGHTDTVALTQVHGDGSVSLVSLPRDAWVASATGMSRLNQIHAAAGMDALRSAVGELTGVAPEHYVLVDMAAVAGLTDAVGGVPVCLRTAVSDPLSGAEFGPGPQVLHGGAALAFLRQRHDLPNGDLDRILRQQVFLRSWADRLRGADLPAVVAAVRGRVTTDEGLDLLGLAEALTSAKAVLTGTIPIEDPVHDTPEGGSAVAVDPAAVREFVGNLRPSGGPAGPPACVN